MPSLSPTPTTRGSRSPNGWRPRSREDPRRLWVASGYFAPSVWAAIGDALDRVGEFRLLLGKDYELANLERGHEEARIADLVRQAIRDETEPPRPRDAATRRSTSRRSIALPRAPSPRAASRS